MDVQGAEKARPWIEKADASYVALVDAFSELGRQFNFNFIPLTLLIDEDGRLVRGPKGTSINRESDRTQISRWIEEGELDPAPPSRANGFSGPEAELRFQAAAVILSRGDSVTAVELLRKALQFDPKNWLIRKQIWAIESPGRFYAGPVDYEWQKRQLQKEMPQR